MLKQREKEMRKLIFKKQKENSKWAPYYGIAIFAFIIFLIFVVLKVAIFFKKKEEQSLDL